MDNFDSADTFLDKCWSYSKDFNEMEYLHEVYADNSGYIVYRMGDFWVGELIKCKDGKITEIYVTFKPTI